METLHNKHDFIERLSYLRDSLREIKGEIWQDFKEINTINERRFNLFKDILPKKAEGVGKYLPEYFEGIPWVRLESKPSNTIINVDFESRAIAIDVEHFIKKDTAGSLSSYRVYGNSDDIYFSISLPVYKCLIDTQHSTLDRFTKYTTASTSVVQLTHDETKWLGDLEEAIVEYERGREYGNH